MNDESRSSEYSETWLDVVAAVSYLTVTHRPGLTVWDAFEEAVRWWTAARLDPADDFPSRSAVELPWSDPDPLRTTLERLVEVVGPAHSMDGLDLPDALDGALTVWLSAMSERFNEAQPFRR